MLPEFKHLLPEDFSDDSRVWIYQSSRLFFISEALEIEEMLEQFVMSWESHGKKVKGYANLFLGMFVVFIADERQTGVSGCSTDASVRLVKEIEKKFKVDLFDRQHLAFYMKEKIQVIPLSQLNYAINNGYISPDTTYFNNTVLTKKDFEDNWMIPLQNSWLAKRLFDMKP